MKTHKIGTFTLGITLILFGILFLLHVFAIPISYELILKLWPIMFIFLGTEILYHYFRFRDEPLSINGGSIFILFLVGCFSAFMAFAELFFEYTKSASVYW
ncbi:LiaF transmembrane domain-containing protein [Velocimicrobium porci]|uniref:LiaI-LiaF-like transmembrane region domain-containing protein n=1 Tax=Velocimicrobium porci TaxID=2606634 RepID=A0A6L5XVQ3_9FIRM|nr:DUF5668 domain-containing protein [Velocimicrobium porci]MSS62471.1 hypothetical protein [Velocimicrobium porci]